MEKYFLCLCIQSECGEIRTRKTSNTDTFYPVYELEQEREREQEGASFLANAFLKTKYTEIPQISKYFSIF